MVVSADTQKTFSVLIVEDSVSTNKIICRTLSMLFPLAIIFSACCGMKGLELYKKHYPDIVITDISMPDMNGLEMVTQIRNVTSNPTVIVFTAHSEGDYLEEFNKIGINNYLLKPLDLTALVSTIKGCLTKKYHESTKVY